MVESEHTDFWYHVIHTNGSMTCTCPDHVHREGICKHMKAVKLYWLEKGGKPLLSIATIHDSLEEIIERGVNKYLAETDLKVKVGQTFEGPEDGQFCVLMQFIEEGE